MSNKTLDEEMNIISCDFVILTALKPEFDAVCSVLGTYITKSISDSVLGEVYTVSLPIMNSIGQVLNGIIVLIDGIGRVHSALTTATVLRKYRPNYILLVGIAGGFEANGVSLGDIIVSTEIIDFAINKITPAGFEFRPHRYLISPDLLSITTKFLKDGNYSYTYNSVQIVGRVHIGPLASGDQIFASSNAIKMLLEKEPYLLGVEMEGAGVAAAAVHEEHPVNFIVVRGVADLADEAKSDKWIDISCFAAASFAVDFINNATT